MSGWTDSAIAKRTRQEVVDGKKCFVIDLPARTLALPCGDKPNVKTLISWCQHVRDAVAADEEEKKARDARERAERSMGSRAPTTNETAKAGAPKQVSAAVPRSPREYVMQGYQEASARLSAASAEFDVAKREYREWSALLAALPESEDEENDGG